MGSPNIFIHKFQQDLHSAGIRFAITSGQACVYFGIQQTTKDSDWIIVPEDLSRLRAMLIDADASGSIRVSYRANCGAPLDRAWMRNGWTSHLAITDADSEEHHLDFFSKAPRVTELDHDANDHNYASRQVVAQMKKTDREKDWPIVFALGRQAVSCGDIRGVLHGQEANWLIETWNNISENERAELVRWRPLLGLIDSEPHRLRRAIAIEKQLWVSVNRERYGVYQRKWKDFYRKWRREPGFRWPPNISFDQQQHRLDEAARKHQLPMAPLDDFVRQEALAKARADAGEILVASDEELAQITPPLEAFLP